MVVQLLINKPTILNESSTTPPYYRRLIRTYIRCGLTQPKSRFKFYWPLICLLMHTHNYVHMYIHPFVTPFTFFRYFPFCHQKEGKFAIVLKIIQNGNIRTIPKTSINQNVYLTKLQLSNTENSFCLLN